MNTSLNASQILADRDRKQTYLKEEVLNKGYDPMRFSEYICSLRTDGANIDNWTFEELKTVVKNYKDSDFELSSRKPQVDEETVMSFLSIFDQKDGDTSSNKLFPGVEETPNLLDQVNGQSQVFQDYDGSKIEGPDFLFDASVRPSIDPRNFQNTYNEQGESQNEYNEQQSEVRGQKELCKVKKQEPTAVSSDRNTAVTIHDPELIKGGVFSSSFVQYTVKTMPFGWQVKRRYSDFFWLRDNLIKLHPGIFIPPIPRKKNKNKFLEENIRKRMFFFEIFLNACLEHEDLRSDKFFFYFLSLIDDNQFNTMKKAADKLPRVTRLNEVSSASGEVVLDLTKEADIYTRAAEDYCAKTEPEYKRIRKLTKMMLVQMKQVATIANDLGDAFQNLGKYSADFNNAVPIKPIRKFEEIYPTMKNVMTTWSESLQKDTNIIYKNIFCFYKYSGLENVVYKELSQSKAKFEADFFRQSQDLLGRKERLFASQDIARWEMDGERTKNLSREELLGDKQMAFEYILENDTRQLKAYKDMIAYLNGAGFTEVSRGLELRCELYTKNFQEFVKKHGDNSRKLHVDWEDLLGCPTEIRPRLAARAQLHQSKTMNASTLNRSVTRGSDITEDFRRDLGFDPTTSVRYK